MRVSLIRFIDEFCSASAPLFGGVAVFSHDLEELEDKVVYRFREVFNYLIGYGVRSKSLTGRCFVAFGGVVFSCENVV